MRPLTLKLSGLHSFRELQTVDFTQVTDAGVFGIFGPTGSGKSTILDAITLALYGRVERSGGNRYGILNQHEPRLHVSFTFQTSSGNERHIYRVERTYKRKDPDGHSVQSTHARLVKCGADGDMVLEDKETAVNEGILAILGLNVDDFTRAVVLPQGKFEEFLKLKGKERRDMLERVFRLNSYGEQLKQRITARVQSFERDVDRIVIRQNELGEATAEAVEAAQQTWMAAKSQLVQVSQEKETCDREYETWQKIREYMRELEAVRVQQQELEQQRADMGRVEQSLQTAERAEQVRPYTDVYRERHRHWEETNDQLRAMQQTVSALSQTREQVQSTFDATQAEWDKRAPQRSEQRAWYRQATEQEQQRDTLKQDERNKNDQLTELQQQIQTREQEKDGIDQQIKRLRAKKEALTQRLMEIRVSTDERQQLRVAEDAMQQLTAEQMRLHEQRDERERLRQALDEQTDVWEKVTVAVQERHQELAELQSARQALDEAVPVQEATLHTRDKQLQDRAYRVDRITSLFAEWEQQHETVKKWQQSIQETKTAQHYIAKEWAEVDQMLQRKEAELAHLQAEQQTQNAHQLALQLAVQLAEDEACPVCGSTHHPAPAVADPRDHEDVQPLADRLTVVVEEVEADRKRMRQLETDGSLLAQKLDHSQEQLANAAASEGKIRKQLDEQKRALPTNYSQVAVKEMESLLAADRAAHEQAWQDYTEWQQQCRQLDEQMQTCQNGHQDLQARVAAEEAKRSFAEKRLQEADDIVTEQAKRVQTAEKEWHTERGKWTFDTLQQRVAELAEWDQERERLETEREECEAKQNQLTQKEEAVQVALTEAQNAFRTSEQEHTFIRGQIRELTEKIEAITEGEPAQQLLSELDADEQRLRKQLRDANEAFRKVDGRWQEAHQRLAALTAQAADHQQQLQTAQHKLQERLDDLDFATVEEAEAGLIDSAERERMGQRLAAYRDQCKQVRHNRDRLEQQLEGRTIDEPEWQAIVQRRQRLEQASLDAQKEVATSEYHYRMKVQKHEQWHELEQERRKQQEQLDHAHDLQQVLKGKAFVEFVAREQLADIAMDASRHLGELTHHRYALEIDRDGGFIMRDNSNGGQRRPVSTLSGGETFLTSLSLALALSSQIQLKGECPLEFFFLDEGFGTLDPDLLDVVITSLEKLHFRHMTIGLISHVPELQHRLHRKLRIYPATTETGTKVEVVYR